MSSKRTFVSFLIIFCSFCEFTKGQRHKRIVNGIRVDEEDASFVTSIQILEENKFKHFCTGTYLGNGFVLTASHCLKSFKICEIYVQIGQIRISNDGLRYKASSFCRKNYDPYTFTNDIALLKLNMSQDDPLYTFEVVNIPKTYNIDISDCKIYGFGSTRYSGDSSEHLLMGNVTPITQNMCESILGRVVCPEYHWGMFCARGIRGVDACSGDSGGGLFCKSQNSTVLVGIVSYGMGCGSDAGVYTSVIHHENWIRNKRQ